MPNESRAERTVSIMRSTSPAVQGEPSPKRAPSRRRKTQRRPSSSTSQLSARAGMAFPSCQRTSGSNTSAWMVCVFHSSVVCRAGRMRALVTAIERVSMMQAPFPAGRTRPPV